MSDERAQEDSMTDDWRTVYAFGRVVTLEIATSLDEFAQFRLAVVVDGKERWHAFFSDQSDPDEEMP